MSNTKRSPHGGRNIRVRAVRRDPPDIKKLSRALIQLALLQAQAEAEAQAAHQDKDEEAAADAA